MSLMGKAKTFLKKPFHDRLNTLHALLCRFKGVLYYRHVFGSFGNGSLLFKPLLLVNPKFIHIGKNVLIRQGVRMETVLNNGRRIPMLLIGDNVNIEQNVHLICHSRILIGRNVSITGNCAIVDVTHPYLDVHDLVKIGDRILDENSFIEIGDESFLGFGTVIMPNVRIGKYCIIGAHSVVTKNVPDYCVAAGNPAKILRRYDDATGEWLRIPIDSID